MDRGRGQFGEFIEGHPLSRPQGLRGDGRNNFGIAHHPVLAHRGDDGHRRLCAAGRHAQVRRVELGIEIDCRHAAWADRGRGEVEHPYAGIGQPRPIALACAGVGGVENQADVRKLGHAQQPVNPTWAGRDPCGGRPGQAVTVRVGANHRAHPQPSAAIADPAHQIGADNTGADDRHRPVVHCARMLAGRTRASTDVGGAQAHRVAPSSMNRRAAS